MLYVSIKGYFVRQLSCEHAQQTYCITWATKWLVEVLTFTDRISGKGNAIGCVRLSFRLFPLYVLNQLTLNMSFCMCADHDHSSPGIESQGHS